MSGYCSARASDSTAFAEVVATVIIPRTPAARARAITPSGSPAPVNMSNVRWQWVSYIGARSLARERRENSHAALARGASW